MKPGDTVQVQGRSSTVAFRIVGRVALPTLSQGQPLADGAVFTGAGFAPGDEVTIESGHSGRVMQKRQRVSADGRLPPDVIAHAATGTVRNARYTVKGRSCEVAVEYTWGEATLSRH